MTLRNKVKFYSVMECIFKVLGIISALAAFLCFALATGEVTEPMSFARELLLIIGIIFFGIVLVIVAFILFYLSNICSDRANKAINKIVAISIKRAKEKEAKVEASNTNTIQKKIFTFPE